MTTLGTDPSKSSLSLSCPYQDRERAKAIPGWRWAPHDKCWVYPAKAEVLAAIQATFPGISVSPDVAQAVANSAHRAREAEHLKAAGWTDAEPIQPMPVRTKPFAHQVLAYNIGLLLPASALLMEMGTGKTLAAIAVAGRRHLDGQAHRLLVVAPMSVLDVWREEFRKHAGFPYRLTVLTGDVGDRVLTLRKLHSPMERRLEVAVTNYEATWRMIEALAEWGPEMIIADESQRIKCPGTHQTKAMQNLGRSARYRMILTGTPVTKSPLDFYSQYKFLDPSIFGSSFTVFRNRYAVMGGYEKHQVIGYRHLDELVRKAHGVAFRITKEEALDLPEMVDESLYCDLEPGTRELYRRLAQESVARLESGGRVTAPNIITEILRLSQMAGGFATDENGRTVQVSWAKLDLLQEMLTDIVEAGNKVVVFFRFLAEIEAAAQMLSKLGIDWACITGEVAAGKRTQEIARFQDTACPVFLAQTEAGSLGIDLTAAHYAVFYSLGYRLDSYEQARSRIHRHGQRNTCTYIHLVARRTVDGKILRALAEKRDMAELVVNRWREFFREE